MKRVRRAGNNLWPLQALLMEQMETLQLVAAVA